MSRAYKILLFLLAFWIIVSVSRTFLNLSKLYTEERYWYGLTDEEKRGKFFGDIHYFLRYLDSNISGNSTILFVTSDTKNKYLARYYLYPAKVFEDHDISTQYPKDNTFNYIVIYPANKTLINEAKKNSDITKYNKIASYKGKNGQIGLIYKK